MIQHGCIRAIARVVGNRYGNAASSRTPHLHTSLSICGIALIIEALVGYPAPLFGSIGHPVTWIGAAVGVLDRQFNRESDVPSVRRRNGAVVLGALLIACWLASQLAVLVVLGVFPPAVAILGLALLASSCLAQRSLDAHVRAVADALEGDGLAAGRAAVARIVGRDVSALDEAGVARAAIESLAENFADGVVAPSLWLALLGLPGAVLYKAINTADSMIGHRTARFEAFGYAAAKLDDFVNWPAARLAGLSLVTAATLTPGASARAAWRIMLRDAGGHPSPNAGWPEAAMAGALGLTLGGARSYAGRTVGDATIGDGGPADTVAIRRALSLYRIACAIDIAVIFVLAVIIGRW